MPHLPDTKNTNYIFIELQSVDSTNNYARKLIQEGMAQNGMAIFAHDQTLGRGQRGKKWESEKGANIALSILIKPDFLKLSQQFWLSACVAVSVNQFLVKYAGDDVKIKWPNDLYWQDRKAGGILIESVVSSAASENGNWPWAIVGIGININQTNFPDWLIRPVSLKQITGKSFNTIELALELCKILDNNFSVLQQQGFEVFFQSYNQALYKRNEKVKLKKGRKVFEALIKSVNQSGQLLIQQATEEEINFGEIEWVF
ncbi:MAG TPA: biotin--[acetyl-CoA-carboxylase] ligase [Chitinophagaceae bacterium]|nr:biotin--[acetyl-CoA-carboxylase] ligase [Chitinophagaceae bacterium]